MMKKRTILSIIGGFAVFLMGTSCKDATPKEEYVDIKYFDLDANGDLLRPKGYRSWVYVGTPVTPNDLNNGKAPFPEMHNVYIDPASYKYYKKTGKWREGTILVKELVSVGAKVAVSGNGYFEGEFIGLEAEVKSKEHFPDEPGNWAIFSFTSPEDGILKEKATKFPPNVCNSCHRANAQDDYVFTQYYPVLRAAKGVGIDFVPENTAKRVGEQKMAAMSQEMQSSQWEATAPTPDNLTLDIPLEKQQLFDYLSSGKYKEFKNQESKLHPSLGPHQELGLPVRVFINDILAKSLEEGNSSHPLGSVSVKEMYDEDKKLSGWAVFAKTQENSDGGNGWFWYELTDPSGPDNILAMGNGVIGCTSCHGIGKDMVRSKFPLE